MKGSPRPVLGQSKLLGHAVWTAPLGRRCGQRAGGGRQLSRLERSCLVVSNSLQPHRL